jgi:hypothetical protein
MQPIPAEKPASNDAAVAAQIAGMRPRPRATPADVERLRRERETLERNEREVSALAQKARSPSEARRIVAAFRRKHGNPFTGHEVGRVDLGHRRLVQPRRDVRAIAGQRGSSRSPRRARPATKRTAQATADPAPEPPPHRWLERWPLVVTDRSCVELLDKSGKVFREWIRKHGLPSFKDGRRLCVRTEHVLALLERLEDAATRPSWEERALRLAAGGSR